MIRHIVALDEQYGMAKNGGQPWKIPDDERYFTDQTKLYGGNILVGRTTFETFHGPLRGRTNYVLTHQSTPIVGVTLVHDLDTFLQEWQGDLWIVGGAAVFAETLERTDELYVTRIFANFGCDQFYPQFDDQFSLASQSEIKAQNGFRYQYEVYRANNRPTTA
jgi:dihydrofolate reductase